MARMRRLRITGRISLRIRSQDMGRIRLQATARIRLRDTGRTHLRGTARTSRLRRMDRIRIRLSTGTNILLQGLRSLRMTLRMDL